METKGLKNLATTEELAGAAGNLPQRTAAHGPGTGHGEGHAEEHGAGGVATSVREATHKGRHIRIETSYRITIDGEAIGGHVMVENDGQVHYHSIPNQEFKSAVDMVKGLIDLLPPEAPEAPAYGRREG